jgi:hypothetical protein
MIRFQHYPVLAWVLLATGGRLAGQNPSACGVRTDCAEVTPFVVTVTNFRTSVNGTDRIVTLTVHIQNKLNRPLVLGYVDGSGIATDDQGNRYTGYGPGVRGIGLVTANSFDPKFALQPGESGDARIEMGWRPTRGAIYGTRYEADLALREIDPVTGNQYRLGKEHALHFSGFGQGETTAAAPTLPATPSANAAPSTGAPAPTPEADPCAGKARCWSEGPMLAEVSSLTAGPVGGRHHMVTITLKVKNISAEPLILAYKTGTSAAIDNLGNRYTFGRPGTHDVSYKGIGAWEGNKADPQFALKPGQSRSATFNVIRFNAGNSQLGTSWSWDVVLAELEILPSNQIRSGREFSISLIDLSTKASSSDLTKKLLGEIEKRVP